MFSAAGDYTLRLTATSGSQSASDTVDITVNLAPQNVDGVWTGTLTFSGGGAPINFALDLEQDDEDVTGTLTVIGETYPVEGMFDGTDLELVNGPAVPFTFSFNVTVTGDAMTGTFDDGGDIYSLTATRAPAP